MERINIDPRPNWNETTLNQGLMWAVTEKGPYWTEAMEQPAYYCLELTEQQELEKAGNEIHQLCFEAMEWLINEAPTNQQIYWLDKLGISDPNQRKMIHDSWNNDEWCLYGRFDFLQTKDGPKLLEYNADTPATLVETSIIQWNWFCDTKEQIEEEHAHTGMNQFNDLHDSLVRHWKDMGEDNGLPSKIHFTGCADIEDMAIVSYLAETAAEAEFTVQVLPIDNIGFDGTSFTDLNDEYIDTIFKFYPWEWLLDDEFGKHIPEAKTRWIEPAWKTILNNKAFLALLYERNPTCKYLVPTFLCPTNITLRYGAKWVTKPIRSRCGSNVCIWEQVTHTVIEHTEGQYGDYPKVYQEFIEGIQYDGKLPMLSVWMVGSDAVALSIRECDSLITTNNSRFIPHVFKEY